MNLAPTRCPGRQTVLEGLEQHADPIIQSYAAVSPYMGDWGEEFASVVLGVPRLQTQAGRFCPDLQVSDRWVIEVKAIGPRNTFRLYRERYEAFRKAHDRGMRIQFLLVFHTAQPVRFAYRHLGALRHDMAGYVTDSLLLSWKTVRRWADAKTWAYTPSRPEAYQGSVELTGANWNSIRNAKPHRPRRSFPCRVYGHKIGYLPFRAYHTQAPVSAQVGLWPADVQMAAGEMLKELDRGWHGVGLALMPDGRKKRVVTERNVDWYERLLRSYPEGTVQRRLVRGNLQRMAHNRALGSHTVEEYMIPAVEEWLDTRTLDYVDEEVPF